MERLLHSESRSKLHLLYLGFGTSSLSLLDTTILICRRRAIPSHFYNASQLHSVLTLMWASVGGRIMVPQRYAHLNPQNLWICTLHGKSNFTDVTKDMERGILSGIIQMTRFIHESLKSEHFSQLSQSEKMWLRKKGTGKETEPHLENPTERNITILTAWF